MADQAFEGSVYASIAKIALLAGSALAAAVGVILFSLSPVPGTAARALK
jgi:hypothetical protein